MLKFIKKNFSSNIKQLENKSNKYVEILIDNNEISKYRLANFIRNRYNLKWDIIQKAIRKKDIFIVRQDNVIRKLDEKLEINDKIFICKYTLNIFDKRNSNEITNNKFNDKTEIKSLTNQAEKKSINDNLNQNSTNREIASIQENSNDVGKMKIKNPDKSEKEINHLKNSGLKINNEFIDENFNRNEDFSEENKFLLELFKGMLLYASNLFFIVDKKYNIASQKGSYLKFSVDDCLKVLNQINPNNNLKLVHRLDRNVSGLMLIGNNLDFVRKIGADMKESRISKTYVCLCQNVPSYFKEMIGEKRIHISRTEHLKESLTGNIFSDESCENFTILTKSGYSFERNPLLNEKINNGDKNFENKEFQLKKLTNFAYNKILSEKISKDNHSNSVGLENNKDTFNMQGIFRITHFIFKDIGEGKGNNFIAFEIDNIENYDEETIMKFNKFLERTKLISKRKENVESNQKETFKDSSIINKQDDFKSLKDLMKKQMKINKKEKTKLRDLKDKSYNEDEFYTVVAYELISGKKHQIRKHMSKSFFTPIFNDDDYFFDTNLSYVAYKSYLSQLEINKKENSLQDNYLNSNKVQINSEDIPKENKIPIKKKNLLGRLEKDDLYQRFNIDDFYNGILLNSFQIKINNDTFSDLKSEKVEYYDKNKLIILRSENELIYQKRFLSNNFKIFFDGIGLSYVDDYFSKIRKKNLI